MLIELEKRRQIILMLSWHAVLTMVHSVQAHPDIAAPDFCW